jgi:hypothetical protein
MWASELFIVLTGGPTLLSDFSGTSNRGITGVQVVMFNCPEYGIGAESFYLLAGDASGLDRFINIFVNPTLTSCENLVRVCFRFNTPGVEIVNFLTTIGLDFITSGTAISLAEVTFFDDETPCPPNVIITPDTTTTIPTTITTTIPTTITTTTTTTAITGTD